MFSFNSALEHIQPSASMKLGLGTPDPTLLNLSIGIPDLPPPSVVGDLVRKFAEKNRFPYIASKGTLAARTNLANLLFAPSELPDPEAEFMLTAGAKFGIYLSLKTCTSIGDEVVIMEPYWLSYPPMAISLGLRISYWKPVVSESGELDFDLSWLEDRLRSQSPKALILNNPNNPSGKVFSPAFLSELIRLTHTYGCWLIVDEVYKHHTFDMELPQMPKAEHIVRIGSVSKSVSLPGLRLGYIHASKDVVEKADLLTQHLLTCITPISNFVAEQLTNKDFEAYRQLSVNTYRSRYHDFVDIFSDRFFILKSEASFYALITPKEKTAENTSDYLKREFRIIATPGSAYGEMFDNYARICLTVDSDEIKRRFAVK